MGAPQILGRYAIYDKIAAGGMATVHFGRLLGAVGFARTVAIKRLHPHLAEEAEVRTTLIDEARLAARIHHPNVVPTLDVVATASEVLVVMEYVRGESLSKLVRAARVVNRPVPLPIVSAIFAGALHGLHAAHEATSDRGAPLGIVHRDVSPQNILVGVDGIARVIDFGIAKAAGRIQTTREGTVKGKMAYMAPEQLAGREVTRQVDVYGIAVVMWEVLTGRPLFQADNDAALVAKVLAGILEPPSRYAPEIPASLDALVMAGLAREPRDRFVTARDMAHALVRAVAPALATDVGAWVEEIAHGTLTRRGAVLAEIERQSEGETAISSGDDVTVAAERGRPVSAPAERPDPFDVPTMASQPSSVSLETPKKIPAASRSRRRGVAVAGAAAAMLAAGVTVFAVANRGPATIPSGNAPSGDQAAGNSAAAAPTPLPPAVPTETDASAPAASSRAAGAQTPAVPRPSAPSRPARPPRKPPSPPPAPTNRAFDPASVR